MAFLLSTSFVSKYPQKKNGVKKVVIDAGHGGHDPGTMGKRSKEKDIALSVALRLGRLIQENFPDVEVIYTRKTDVFVELYRRAQIANEKKADLFISIHCNGTRSSEARGVETWVMGLHKSKENLEVAKKENASILMEDNYSQYDGFDPNSPEATIIFSLYQNVYLDQSLEMATLVQDHFHSKLGLIDRGVKQAGFWVLYKTTMPGILVETGFLSNPSDEEYLRSENGQDNIAIAIFNAFADYKGEKKLALGTSPLEIKNTKVTKISTDSNSAKEQKTQIASIPQTSLNEIPKSENSNNNELNEKVVFKVQIISSPKKLPDRSSLFKGCKDISMYSQKGIYKYTVGECPTLDEALKLQSEMQKKGFKDAFVVAFYKGERIPVEEARKYANK
ncbi:MAG: N-acetylmuramoyl-L-alanine amidase [Bacteroidales bacterium]